MNVERWINRIQGDSTSSVEHVEFFQRIQRLYWFFKCNTIWSHLRRFKLRWLKTLNVPSLFSTQKVSLFCVRIKKFIYNTFSYTDNKRLSKSIFVSRIIFSLKKLYFRKINNSIRTESFFVTKFNTKFLLQTLYFVLLLVSYEDRVFLL